MKKQYDVNNLGLANVSTYLNGVELNGYYTIVSSENNCIIDLQYPDRKISTTSLKEGYSYSIEYFEPLTNFEKNRKSFTRVEALKSLKKHMSNFQSKVMVNYETILVQK